MHLVYSGDYSKYIGIPFLDLGRDFGGCDCFGLIKLFYQEEFGLILPDVNELYSSARNTKEVEKAVQKYHDVEGIVPLQPSQPYLPYDVLVFKALGVPCHVGMIINNKYDMLHIFRGCDSVIERYDYPKWQKRLAGGFRHVRNI